MKKTTIMIGLILFLVASPSMLFAAGQQEGATGEEKIVELEMWTGWAKDHYMFEVFEGGLNEFMSGNPNIKVVHNQVSWGQIITKAVSGVAAGQVPNAVWGWDPLEFYGASTNLNDFIESDPAFNKDDLFDVAWDFVTVDEEIIALPAVLEPTVFLYNPDRLAEVGYNEPPSKIEEIAGYVDKLIVQDSDGTIEKLGYYPGQEAYVWKDRWNAFWPALFGADWFDEGANKFELDTPETMEYYNWTKTFNKKYGSQNILRYLESHIDTLQTIDGGTGPYYEGDIAFWIAAPWMLRINELDPSLNIKVTAAPRKPGGGPISSGCVWWIPKGAEHPEETWTFYKYLASKDWQVRYSGPGADPLPPTNKAAVEALSQEPELQWLQVLIQEGVFETGKVPPRVKAYKQLMKEFSDNEKDIFFSEKPVADVLNEMEQRINEEL